MFGFQQHLALVSWTILVPATACLLLQSPGELTVEYLRIVSTNMAKTPSNAALFFSDGLTKSYLSYLAITNEGNETTMAGRYLMLRPLKAGQAKCL